MRANGATIGRAFDGMDQDDIMDFEDERSADESDVSYVIEYVREDEESADGLDRQNRTETSDAERECTREISACLNEFERDTNNDKDAK